MSLELYYVYLLSFCDVQDDANGCRVEEDIGYRWNMERGGSVSLYVAFSPGVGSFGKWKNLYHIVDENFGINRRLPAFQPCV